MISLYEATGSAVFLIRAIACLSREEVGAGERTVPPRLTACRCDTAEILEGSENASFALDIE